MIVAALCLVPLTMLGVRLFGLSSMLSMLERVAPRRSNTSVQSVRIGALVNAVADRLPVRASCLERSVAVAWLLRRHARACALVIESKVVPTFEAHAWVDTPDGPIGAREPGATELARWPLVEPPAL